MKESEFNPYLRYYNKVVGAPVYPRMLCAYDHRLFYISKGEVDFVLKGATHRLGAGDMIVIPPARPYKLTFSGEAEYYLLNFDFTAARWGEPARSPLGERHFDLKDIFSAESLPPFGEVAILRRCEGLEPLLEEMDTEQPLLASALLKTLLVKGTRREPADDPVQRVKDYVLRHRDEGLTNQQVARHFGYHPHYLNSLFAEAAGCTLHRYIVEVRVRRAKELLDRSQKSVAVIAREMGFKDGSYFSAFFKKAAGMSPREYRKLSR